jgi:rubrerythrin
MSDTKDFHGLIELAISEEQKAQRLYKDLAAKAEDDYAKAILEGLHEQEVKHEERLRTLLASIDPSNKA